ncbi:MAG TPA: PIN domain-containing protein [archaeon]|nr:PIN domain-containing protein [archaeon]
MKYFFDTYALFEIYRKNEAYKKFLDEDIVTGNLNLGELYYGFLKEGKKKIGAELFNKLANMTIQENHETIRKAMEFRHLHKSKKFSYIDCISYINSMEKKLLFLTGDEQFREIPGVEFVK